MDLEHIVDHLHDDIVEILFSAGFVKMDGPELKRVFSIIHLAIARRMEQAQGEHLRHTHRQVAELLERERERLMGRLWKVSKS